MQRDKIMTFSGLNDSILIVSAVKEELKLLKSKASDINSFLINDIEITTGTIHQRVIIFASTGPGVVNTAYALTVILEKIKPRLVIQTGCAGAFENSGITTGDVGIATCEIDCHTGIEAAHDAAAVPTPLPFPLLSKNNTDYTHTFPTDNNAAETAFRVLSETGINRYKVVKAPFITVSTVTATDKRKDALFQAYQPCMESMEGSAAAHIALLYDIPFLEIRAASNTVGKRDKSKWNLPLAFENSNIAVFKILNTIKTMNLSGIQNEK